MLTGLASTGWPSLGVDEHVWHHVSTKAVEDGGRGPKELTGMVDLTRDLNGRTRARLLDLVPGRSGETYRGWLEQRGDAFKAGVEIATLDPFHGYKNAAGQLLRESHAGRRDQHLLTSRSRTSQDNTHRWLRFRRCSIGGCRSRPGTPPATGTSQPGAVGADAFDDPERVDVSAGAAGDPGDGALQASGRRRELAFIEDFSGGTGQDRQGVGSGVGVHADDEWAGMSNDRHGGRRTFLLAGDEMRRSPSGRHRPG